MNDMTPQPAAPGAATPSPIAAKSPVDGFFRLTERGTSVGRDVFAGCGVLTVNAVLTTKPSGVTEPSWIMYPRPSSCAFIDDGAFGNRGACSATKKM